MPRSKRNKVGTYTRLLALRAMRQSSLTFPVSLTKTKKKGKTGKVEFISEIQQCITKYSSIYVIQPHNMRNNRLQELRIKFRSSRLHFPSTLGTSTFLLPWPENPYLFTSFCLCSSFLVVPVPLLLYFCTLIDSWCRFFFGKNKVICKALTSESVADKLPNIDKLCAVRSFLFLPFLLAFLQLIFASSLTASTDRYS